MRARLRAGAVFATLALTLLLTAGDALAGACCVSTTADGIGRLKLWEEFAVGFSTPVSVSLGYWDADGDWRSYGEGYTEVEWRPSLYTIVRVSDRALVSGVIPAVMTWRDATSTSDLGGGIGDVSAGVRYQAVKVGEYDKAPGVALTLSLLAPTGTPPDRASGALGADTTGRGAFVVSAGVTAEYIWWPWFLQLNAGASVPLPFRRSDTGKTQRFGPGFNASLIGGWEVAPRLVLSAQLRVAYESETVTSGRVVPDSSRVDAGVGLSAAWTLIGHWTLVANIDTGLFVSHLGDNAIGRVTPGLSVRYGHF